MSALTDRYRAAYPELDELWDEEDQCWAIKEISGYRVAVVRLMFTAAVIIGDPHDQVTYYLDRWCYNSIPDAVHAAREWEGPWPSTEPSGWHRHPATGRRLDEHGRAYQRM